MAEPAESSRPHREVPASAATEAAASTATEQPRTSPSAPLIARSTVLATDPLHVRIDAAHTGPVRSVAFGQVEGVTVLASAGADGTVRLWDPATGTPGGEPLSGHTGGVQSVAFGKVERVTVLASGGADGTVRLWDPAMGTPRGETLSGHTGGVWSVAFGQVERVTVLASAGADGTVRLWDPATGTSGGETLTGHTGGVQSVAFGQIEAVTVLASGGADGTVRLWDPATGTPRGDPLSGHTGGVWSVAFGQVEGACVLASGGADGTVRLWDPATGTPRGDPLTGHTGGVRSVAFGQVDGATVLASAATDTAIDIESVGHSGLLTTDPVAATEMTETEPGRDAITTGDDEATEDDLGREVLAGHLVGVLGQLAGSRGGGDRAAGSVVVSLDGRWGSGKSVLAKLVRDRLTEAPTASPPTDPAVQRLQDPVVVHFDTWRESNLGPEWWSLAGALNRTVRSERAGITRAAMTAVGAWRRLLRSRAVLVAVVVAATLMVLARSMAADDSAKATNEAIDLITKIVTGVSALAALGLGLGRVLFWTSPTFGRLYVKSDDNPLQEISEIVGRLRRWAPRRGIHHRVADTTLGLWLLLVAAHGAATARPPEESGGWWLAGVSAALAAGMVVGGLSSLPWSPAPSRVGGSPTMASRWARLTYPALAAALTAVVVRYGATAEPGRAWFPWTTLVLGLLGVAAYAWWLRAGLAQPRRPILLVLDDVDRCHEAEAVKYLETVHTLMRHQPRPGAFPIWRQAAPLVVLVLGDGRWVRTAFSNVYSTFADLGDPSRSLGADFIQKLFDHTVLVPELTATQVRHYVDVVTDSPPSAPQSPTDAPTQPRGDTAESALSLLGPGAQPATPSAGPHAAVMSPAASQLDPDLDVRQGFASDTARERARRLLADQTEGKAREAERKASESAARQRAAHLLTRYPHLMPGNPRLIRRVVNAWGMLEALKSHVLHSHDDDTVVRAAVFLVRFPTLVDELIDTQSPPTAQDLLHTSATASATSTPLPWHRPDVVHVLRRPDGSLVEPKDLGECYGRQYPPAPPSPATRGGEQAPTSDHHHGSDPGSDPGPEAAMAASPTGRSVSSR